jgi:hypothetical protein
MNVVAVKNDKTSRTEKSFDTSGTYKLNEKLTRSRSVQDSGFFL